MSKKGRVNMAEILIKSGYSKRKVLDAISYPFCIAVRQVAPLLENVTLSDLEVDGFEYTGERERILVLANESVEQWEKPKIPLLDYVKLPSKATIEFLFSNKRSAVLVVNEQMEIPGAPTWPKLPDSIVET